MLLSFDVRDANDPRIGRFVSPDPVIPNPAFSQSYNRYAYVHNNPLSYTDPTRYNPFKAAKKAVKSVGRAIGGVFKGIGRAIKDHAIDAVVVFAFTMMGRPELGAHWLQARAAQRAVNATSNKRTRLGPESRGGGTPGIMGRSSVFMADKVRRPGSPELPPVIAPHTNAVINVREGLDLKTAKGRYVLAAVLILLNEWPLPQSGFSVIGGSQRDAEILRGAVLRQVSILGGTKAVSDAARGTSTIDQADAALAVGTAALRTPSSSVSSCVRLVVASGFGG